MNLEHPRSTACPGLQHRRPLWLGALLAPLSAPIALFVSGLIEAAAHGRPMSGNQMLELAALLCVGGLPLACAELWLFGLPWALLLRWQQRLSVPWLLVGAIPLGILTLKGGLQVIGAQGPGPLAPSVGAASGLVVALAFAMVSSIGWRRPLMCQASTPSSKP